MDMFSLRDDEDRFVATDNLMSLRISTCGSVRDTFRENTILENNRQLFVMSSSLA